VVGNVRLTFAQIVRTWRDLGLVHGDIKPDNIMVKLPELEQSSWQYVKDVCGSILDGVVVCLADVEGAVALPEPHSRRDDSEDQPQSPALSGVYGRARCVTTPVCCCPVG
jgi:hypothetical protein